MVTSMQRKATDSTRGPNAAEKRYQGWVAEQPCMFCGAPGPSIVDHCKGATFKHNKVLIGHYFVVSKCFECDEVKTKGGFAAHMNKFGVSHSTAWGRQHQRYTDKLGVEIPYEVELAISNWYQ